MYMPKFNYNIWKIDMFCLFFFQYLWTKSYFTIVNFKSSSAHHQTIIRPIAGHGSHQRFFPFCNHFVVFIWYIWNGKGSKKRDLNCTNLINKFPLQIVSLSPHNTVLSLISSHWFWVCCPSLTKKLQNIGFQTRFRDPWRSS